MPLFYFHVRHQKSRDEDLDGLSFEDIGEAKTGAIQYLREVVADELRSAHAIEIVALDIADQRGNVVATVTVEEAILKPLGDSNGDQRH